MKIEENDPGVNISNNLISETHKITGETCNPLRNLKMAFTYIDEDMIKRTDNNDTSKIGVLSFVAATPNAKI